MPRGGKRPGAGRPKGSPNKKTAEARAVALAFLDRRTAEEIDALWEATKAEDAPAAMRMWLQAQEFVLPKLGRTEVTGEDGGPVEYVVRDLAKEKPDPA